jgi:two-component system, chemotaxis family, sensor kinase Cph1
MIPSTRPKPSAGAAGRSRIVTRVAEDGAGVRQRTSLERELRRLERRNDELRARTAEADEARGALLSMLSHDLRNPLSVIQMSARLLVQKGELGGSRRMVDALMRAADELNMMAQEMSDAGRLQMGHLAVERKRVALGPLVERAVTATRPLAESKGAEVAVDLGSCLPEVVGDRERLGKVMTDLLANAIKFTPKNSAIRVRALATEAEVRVSVTDAGPGIAGDQHAQLFSLPKTARTRLRQGEGLSLYVAKGVAEAHGGRLGVESEAGRGATFTLSLPLGGEEDAAE